MAIIYTFYVDEEYVNIQFLTRVHRSSHSANNTRITTRRVRLQHRPWAISFIHIRRYCLADVTSRIST